MREWAEATLPSNETTRGHVCKMLRCGWRGFFWPYLSWYLSDAIALGKCAGICREMWVARALHYLADGGERVGETESVGQLRHSRPFPGNIISSMVCAEPVQVPRRAPQTAIISLRNRNAFDTSALITSERLAGAQLSCFYFPSCAKGALVLLLLLLQSFWRAGLVEPASWTKHSFTSGQSSARQLQLI